MGRVAWRVLTRVAALVMKRVAALVMKRAAALVMRRVAALVMKRAAGLAMKRVAGLATVSLLVAPQALAATWTCAPTPTVLVAGLGNCRYGPAVITGEAVLVPKVCLHETGGAKVLRHSVESRRLDTGARLNQASLPAQPTSSQDLPPPGSILAGTAPLLVVPQGIAACDLQSGSAELVYEAQGRLLGAARNGDVLALVEALPPEGRGKPARLEWTVLDLEGASVIGQVLVAGASIEGVALQRTGKALTAVLWQVAGGRRQQMMAAVYSDSGAPLAKQGDLSVSVTNGPNTAADQQSWPQVGFCPTAMPQRGALAGRPAMAIQGGPAVAGNLAASIDPQQVERLLLPGPFTCFGAALASSPARGVAWLKTAKGGAELRALRCQLETAPGSPAP